MTLEKIRKLIASQLHISVDKIKPESKIIEDLGADSLDVMEMIMTLEEEFGISIPDEDTALMATVQGVANVVDGKLKK